MIGRRFKVEMRMNGGYPSEAKGRNEEEGVRGTKDPNETNRGEAGSAKF